MQLTTQLDAVNSMLSLIGEMPITSLSGEIPADAAIAKNTLNDAIRDIQMQGWFFNTEKCRTLAKDNSGFIKVPANTIRVSISPVKYRTVQPVLRGGYLYDTKHSTKVFTEDIIADEIIFMLDFEELPEAARKYAAVRAARIFQSRNLGSQQLTSLSMKDEMDARTDLMHEEAQSSEASLLYNPTVLRTTLR